MVVMVRRDDGSHHFFVWKKISVPEIFPIFSLSLSQTKLKNNKYKSIFKDWQRRRDDVCAVHTSAPIPHFYSAS